MGAYSPEDIGLSSTRLEIAQNILLEKAQSGYIPAAVMAVGRGGKFLEPFTFGRLGPGPGSPPTAPDTVFLVASLTKPVTATAVMMLVQEGRLALSQPVTDFIPEFGNRGKDQIKVFHLLTHTSGLPDMLPQNIRLREENAPYQKFVEGIYECDLLFPPGTNVSYQSAGFAMLGEIVKRLTGQSLRDFERDHLFPPLGMTRSSLGIRDDLLPHVAHIHIPDEQVGTNYDWNSMWWRNLGVPWGGMFSTAPDQARFYQMFLDHGRVGSKQYLSPAVADAMTKDQLWDKLDLPPAARIPPAWGLGWGLRSQLDLASPGSFGHGGATGTWAWADPARELVFVLLTSQPRVISPQGHYLLIEVGNVVAAACL